jgi:hypothetical protein
MGERGLLGFIEFPFIVWRTFTPCSASTSLKSKTWNLLIAEDGGRWVIERVCDKLGNDK